MLALVYDRKAEIRRDYPTPVPTGDEVLIRVKCAGICRTDLEITRGYMNFTGVMGHEFVGIVAEGPPKWKDKRVTAEINCICGKCDMCTSGLSNHCRNRTVLGIDGRDGASAEYVAVPADNLHEVPEGIDDVDAVFIEPLAAAFQIVRQIKIKRSDEVVVLGDGRLGQLVARVLRGRNDQLLMVGKHPTKLAAAEKKGIQPVGLEEFHPRGSADVVIDATGRAGGFQLAMRTARPRGTIVLKSTFATSASGGPELDFSPLVINELTVVGSRCGPFRDAIKALNDREVEVDDLVTRRFNLRDGLAALEAAADPQNLKVILDVG